MKRLRDRISNALRSAMEIHALRTATHVRADVKELLDRHTLDLQETIGEALRDIADSHEEATQAHADARRVEERLRRAIQKVVADPPGASSDPHSENGKEAQGQLRLPGTGPALAQMGPQRVREPWEPR